MRISGPFSFCPNVYVFDSNQLLELPSYHIGGRCLNSDIAVTFLDYFIAIAIEIRSAPFFSRDKLARRYTATGEL